MYKQQLCIRIFYVDVASTYFCLWVQVQPLEGNDEYFYANDMSQHLFGRSQMNVE